MNPYSIFSLMGFLANLCLGVYILSKEPKKTLNRIFALFAFCLAFWAFGEFMWLNAPDIEEAFLWDKISGFGYFFFPVFLLHFMFIFCKKEEFLKRKIIYLLLYLPSLIFLYLLWNTNLMAKGMTEVYWGYTYIAGKLAGIFILWMTIISILCLYLCFQLYRKTKIKREKMQAKFAGIALLIPIVIGIVTDAFLPAVGIQVFHLAIIGTTVMAILIAHTIQRYQLMSPGPVELFEGLVDIMNEPFVIVNPEGTIKTINPILGKLLGYNEEELIGKPLMVIFAGNVHSKGKGLEELTKEEPIINYECIFLTKNDKEIPVSFSTSAIKDREGELIGVIGVAQDMRETKRLIQKERELATTAAIADLEKKRAEELEKSQDASLNILEDLDRQHKELDDAKAYVDNIIKSMVDTLIVVDSDGNIKTVNKATEELLGYNEDRLIGKPAGILFAEEEEEEEELLFKGTKLEKLLKEGSVRDYDMTYKTKTGEKIPVSFSGSAMRDEEGNLIGIVGVAKDLSDIKRMVEELKMLDKMKSEFLDLAAHELMTPLVSSKTNVEMLIDEDIGEISEEQKKALVIINKNIEKLSTLIKEMLSLTEMVSESFVLKTEPVSIPDVVKEIISYEKAEVSEKGLNFIMDLPGDFPLVEGDKKLIAMALKNLIRNAVQYTSEHGTITVSVADEGKNIHLKVSDTGIGIPKEEQEKIFNKFYQLKRGASREPGGLGIGLSIAKRIVERHNGKIWVESAVGKGSTFHVLLPITLKTKIT